jgi:hypothetical protein
MHPNLIRENKSMSHVANHHQEIKTCEQVMEKGGSVEIGTYI